MNKLAPLMQLPNLWTTIFQQHIIYVGRIILTSSWSKHLSSSMSNPQNQLWRKSYNSVLPQRQHHQLRYTDRHQRKNFEDSLVQIQQCKDQMVQAKQLFIQLQQTINNQNVIGFSNIRMQISNLNSTMHLRENGKLPSQHEASNSCNIWRYQC